MKHRHKSPYEKYLHECPKRCGQCTEYNNGCCTANGCFSVTYDFSNPQDRPFPLPFNCYWWYANRNWEKLSDRQISEYKEERLHKFVIAEMLRRLPTPERKNAFIHHVSRPDGGGLIDFNIYPETLILYEFFYAADNGELG